MNPERRSVAWTSSDLLSGFIRKSQLELERELIRKGDLTMSTPQILVVEDEGITAMDLEARLKRLGYSVPSVASSGEEAILRAEETHPDLVLMDIMLRGQTDGVQAAQEVQTRFGIPVVYLTTYFDDATLERAKATEPFGYIIKPFKDINLRTSIEVALRRREAEIALRSPEAERKSLDRE